MTDGRAGGSRVRTVFLGSGGFGPRAAAVLAGHPDIDLVGVVTAPARPPVAAGRAPRPRSTRLPGRRSRAAILTPERLRATPTRSPRCWRCGPTSLVLADYGQIVPAALLDLPHGALNLHPSLLPRHRGATPIPAAILAGDRRRASPSCGWTTGLDTGPIVAQRRAARGDETAPDLEATLAGMAAELLDETLGPWLRGEVPARRSRTTGATLTRPLRREDGRLDPSTLGRRSSARSGPISRGPARSSTPSHGRLVVWAASVGPRRTGPPGAFGPPGLATGRWRAAARTRSSPPVAGG